MADTESEREAIAREHRQISERLTRLESTSDPTTLTALLDELRELLRSHFAREEAAEGLHAAVGHEAPNLIAAIDELRDEHREIQTKVERLFHQSRQLLEIAGELDQGAQDLVQQLRDHETREDDLFGNAVYHEIGVGD